MARFSIAILLAVLTYARADIFCAGDVETPCSTNLCHDSIRLEDHRITSGCATKDICEKTGCKLFTDKFVCCCSGTTCNGKSASLLKSRMVIHRDQKPIPQIMRSDKTGRLNPRDVPVAEEPKEQPKTNFAGLKQAAKTASKDIQKEIKTAVAKAEAAVAETLETAAEKKEEVKAAAATAAETVADKAQEAKEAVAQKAQEAKKTLAETAKAVADKASEANAAASEVAQAAADKVGEVKDAAVVKTQEAKETIAAKAAETKEGIVAKAEEVKNAAIAKADEAKEAASALADKAKETISINAEKAAEQVADAASEVENEADTAKEEADALKEKAEGTIDAAEEQVDSDVEEMAKVAHVAAMNAAKGAAELEETAKKTVADAEKNAQVVDSPKEEGQTAEDVETEPQASLVFAGAISAANVPAEKEANDLKTEEGASVITVNKEEAVAPQDADTHVAVSGDTNTDLAAISAGNAVAASERQQDENSQTVDGVAPVAPNAAVERKDETKEISSVAEVEANGEVPAPADEQIDNAEAPVILGAGFAVGASPEKESEKSETPEKDAVAANTAEQPGEPLMEIHEKSEEHSAVRDLPSLAVAPSLPEKEEAKSVASVGEEAEKIAEAAAAVAVAAASEGSEATSAGAHEIAEDEEGEESEEATEEEETSEPVDAAADAVHDAVEKVEDDKEVQEAHVGHPKGAVPLSDKDSKEDDSDEPLPPSRREQQKKAKESSYGIWLTVGIVVAILVAIGFVFIRRRNQQKKNARQPKEQELVLVDPLLKEKAEKVPNETPTVA